VLVLQSLVNVSGWDPLTFPFCLYWQGPQFTMDHEILSPATEFARFRRISMFLHNFYSAGVTSNQCKENLKLVTVEKFRKLIFPQLTHNEV